MQAHADFNEFNSLGKAIQVVMKLINLTKTKQMTWLPSGSNTYEASYNGLVLSISSPFAPDGFISLSPSLINLSLKELQSQEVYKIPTVSGLDTLFYLVYRQVNPNAGLDAALNRILA